MGMMVVGTKGGYEVAPGVGSVGRTVKGGVGVEVEEGRGEGGRHPDKVSDGSSESEGGEVAPPLPPTPASAPP